MWRVGDECVCVDGSCHRCGAPVFVEREKIYVVDQVLKDRRGTWLGLAGTSPCGCNPSNLWLILAFRKVVRDKAEACDVEFTQLLARIKEPT